MGDDNEINKLDPKELDRLLKFGAYEAFADEKDDDYSEDIEHILARSEKLQYAAPATVGTGLSSFSKAKFISNDDASVVEIDDENFWEKILPEYTNVRKLTTVLKDKSAFATPESRAKFFKDLQSLVNEAQRDDEATFRHEVIEFLRTIRNVSDFTEDEKSTVESWTAILEGPRLRSRKTKHKLSHQDEEEDKADDRDYQQQDEEEDSEDDEIEEDVFRAPTEKSQFSKPQIPHTSVIKPTKPQQQQQQQQQAVPKAEWTKPARDRFKSALLQYGYGRWIEIVAAAGLKSKGVVSVQSFAECFLQIILLSMNDETYHDLYKQLIGATTKIDFVLPPEGPGELEASVRQSKFCPSDTIELVIKKSGVMPPTEETCTVILEYHATEKQSHCVRGVTFKSVTDLEQVRIIAPGLMGTYSINVFIPGFKSAKTKIEVVCHPIFINDMEFKDLIEKNGKNWAQRLQFLWGVKLITDKYGPELLEMPDLANNRYIPSWFIPGKDDKALLAGIYKFGYGKFKDIFMCEGSSFESFIANLETPIKLQTNALQRRAETLINEFFKLLRNDEQSRRSTTEQAEAAERQTSPQPEQPQKPEINPEDFITIRVKGQDNTHIVFSNQLKTHNLAFIIDTYWDIMNKKGELRDVALSYNGKIITHTTTPLDLGMTEGTTFVINASWATNQPEVIIEELQLNRQTRYLFDYNRLASRLLKDYESRYPATNDETIKYIFNDKIIPFDVTLTDFGFNFNNNTIKVNRTIAFSFKHVETNEVSSYEIPLETSIYLAVENFCELKSLNIDSIQILYQTQSSNPKFLSKDMAKKLKVTAKCCIILAPRKLVIKVTGPAGEVSFRVSTSMTLEKLFKEYCSRTSQDIKTLRFEDEAGRTLVGTYTLYDLDFKEITIQAKGIGDPKPKPAKKEICVMMNKHMTRFLVGGGITLESLRKHFCSRNDIELRSSLRFKYQNKIWPITSTLDELNVKDGDLLELLE